MLKVLVVLYYMIIKLSLTAGSALIKIDNDHNIDQLTSCVVRFMEGIPFKNLRGHRDVTVVNDNGDLKLSTLHNKENIRFVSRKFSWSTEYIYNRVYIITSMNYQELENGLNNMTSDPFWNPSAKFIIVVHDLENNSLKNLTYMLHKYNIIYNITVISQKDDDYAIYKYNITSPSNCVQDNHLTLVSWCSVYRNRSSLPFLKHGGVRNCSYKLITHNVWPYVNVDSRTRGIEHILIHLFKKHVGINVDLDRSSRVNRYGEPQENFTIKLVEAIARNEAEGVFGGLAVRPFYSGNFSYTNPWSIDHVSFILPHASLARQWAAVSQNTQWTFVVLALLFISFCVAASALSVFRRREADIVSDILTVFGYFLNKSMTRNTRPGWSRSLIVSALLYASFIFPFVLQTNLCSMTTQPLRNYEPQTVSEIRTFKPMLYSESVEKYFFPRYVNCGSRYNCLQNLLYMFDEKHSKFTAMSDFYFSLYRYQIIDKRCKPALYKLKDPLIKIFRTFIFRRGSALLHPMNRFLLQFEASGVFNKISGDIFARLRKPCPPGRTTVNPPIKLFELRPVFIILLIGYCLSALVFLFELKFRILRQ